MVFGHSHRRALQLACSPLVIAAVFAATAPHAAHAQSAADSGAAAPGTNINLGSVTSIGNGSGELANDALATTPGSAAASAPSRTPFDAKQPTSVVSQKFIDNSVPPTGNYDDAIKDTPSVSNVEPNGPGLQESKTLSIRGFQDGQYNVYFDTIPYAGDPTSNHHESAVYFTDNDLGAVQVDRGPGTGATVGDATFGGTLSLTSKDPLSVPTATAYGSYGSFDTYQAGLEYDTGAIASANGASAFFDAQHDGSDGYLTNSDGRRNNFFGKLVIPLNSNTVLTFVGMDNHTVQNTPQGATIQEISEFGPNFGLTNNPASQAFEGYNINTYSTDFEYAGLTTTLPFGITLDNKVYTNAFYHDTLEGSDPNDPTEANLTTSSKTKYYLDGVLTTLSNAVPGKAGLQDYRGYGDVLRLTVPIPDGQFETGIWVEHEVNSYSDVSVDLSADAQTETTSATGSPYKYLLDDSANTIQPYAAFNMTPLPGLTVTPGVKVTAFGRGIDAAINSSTKKPLQTYEVYSDVEPSVEVRYVPMQGLSTYVQAAKGFLQPPLNAFFTTDVSPLKPETTWNYQAGATYQVRNTTVSADVYYIDFSNFIQSNPGTGALTGQTVYSNGGGVIYKGVEFEGTQNITHGFSLYGNFTLNSAVYTNGGATVASVPRRTMAAGMIYNQGPLYGSLIGKIIGPQWGQDTSGSSAAPEDQFVIKTYSEVDAAIAYQLPVMQKHTVKLRLNIDNLFNNTNLVSLAGTESGNADVGLYFTNPGRSVFGSVAVSF